MRAGAVFVVAVVLVAVVAVGEPVGVVSFDVALAETVESPVMSGSEGQVSSGSDVAAVPVALPLPEKHFVGSVLYKRTVGMERFDTDHDIDGDDGEDREIFGSHYVMGNEFKVRIPASYADKPDGVFGFSFNHIVFEVSGSRFTTDCNNPRTYLYRDTSSWRWICSLDFGSKADSWNSAIRTASEVKLVALWSDEECEARGAYGINKDEDLLTMDCRALLAIKHYWLDEVVGNREDLSSDHALFGWGVGNIEDWGGVEVGEFHSYVSEFTSRERCFLEKVSCSKRVVFVSLPRVGKVGIAGGVPVEFGGQSGGCNIVKRVLCGLGALQFLDLSGNSLSGVIPKELGNAAVAPCEPDERVFSLKVNQTVSLGMLALAFFGFYIPVAGPYIAAGATIVGLTASIADHLGHGIEVDLDSYFSGCPKDRDVLDSPYRNYMPVEGNDDLGGELRSSVDGSVIAFELASYGSSGEDFVVRSLGQEWKFSAKAAKAVGGFASMIGAILDAYDVVSGLYKLDRLEFFHQNRSQLAHLDLSGNNLSGAVPDEIENLEKLRRLFLNDNDLVGSIPERIGRSGRAANDSLAVMDLSGNLFSGEVPDIFSSNLRYLDLSYNRLSGTVPAGLSLSPELRYVDLSQNAFADFPSSGLTGNINEDIISLRYLEYLDLSRNKLSGELSSSIGVERVIARYSKTESPTVGVTMTVIHERKRRLLENLRYFDVSHNMLYGEIPNNFKNLDELLDLYLNNNCFHGDKPELPGSVKRFDFSSNFFVSQTGGSAGCGPCFNGTHLPVNAGGELKMDCLYLVGLRSSLNGSQKSPYQLHQSRQCHGRCRSAPYPQCAYTTQNQQNASQAKATKLA